MGGIVMIEEIKNLIEEGKDPNDFEIDVVGDSYSITPKWFYETKQIAQKEDKPIIEDVGAVGETIAYNFIDVNDLAETLAFIFIDIDNLISEIETLKGGNK